MKAIEISLLFRYHIGSKTSIRSINFIFDFVNLFYYKCHKINANRGGSYIDSPDWIKNKKAKLIPIKNGNKCFQYAVTITLNHEEIKKKHKEHQKLSLL